MKTVLIYDAKADFYADALRAAVPSLTYLTATREDDAIAKAADAHAIVSLAPRLTAPVWQAAKALEWVQALTTGVDNLVTGQGALPKHVALSHCNGFHGPQMSELAILLMLASARQFAKLVENQKARAWERWPQPLLQGKTLCILGLGSIAETLAPMAAAMGMRVTGVSGRSAAPSVDKIYPRAQITKAAAEADFMVVLIPYTADTHHIVDAALLDAMKPTAHVINLARGGCVDAHAVAAALRAGTLAGAGMDVFEQEPLPDGSPLWDCPRLIITPHIGGMADTYHEQALPIVTTNMADYAAGGAGNLKGSIQ